ncbi:molybdopterin molybdenumtransferase MoeA [Sphingomonas spermidinifaciens]|uniref:Molybdopterin molybdenumtransferase n=1 Tax=Sphingomonas spermidinifaciens TaxID=1141889 RepID=A0A2A4B548_9SPHN|nr:molybdopterin molybdotransferase MoeA [Sphingomonas spermidinifaciens]PCD03187.1 molybdopterin molybdenumtransferase MoeA [Sphingomonas spermidinifaciens]
MGLLPVAEAQARLLALAPPLSIEDAPLGLAAGRWAASAVTAKRTQPARDLSAMDGFAIAHADLPGPFRMIGESAAGRPFAGRVGAIETVRIFTGAAMPAGANCVLVQEEARVEGTLVHLAGEGPGHPGRNVRPAGLDFSEGDGLIAAGERLTPARIALAAVAGHATLPVRRRVRVAIAATGDELRPAGAPLGDGDLPESNGVMLSALLADLPVDLLDLGILPDRLEVLRDAFAGARPDVLVTTGGASVGDHDLVRPALEAAGAAIDFWRVALRPGKPMLAGRLGDGVVVGLPGNPVSAFVTATLFVRPLIAHLSGAADPFPATAPAVLGEPLPANGERTDYLRGRRIDGRVHIAAIQDSSMLRTLARADCLVLRQAHEPAAAAGDSVEILDLA